MERECIAIFRAIQLRKRKYFLQRFDSVYIVGHIFDDREIYLTKKSNILFDYRGFLASDFLN